MRRTGLGHVDVWSAAKLSVLKFQADSPVQETTLADLQAGRDNLQAELRERTGQLKALVKENFDHFISCKTTIDDIHKRLRDAEAGHAGGNSSYVSTNDVIDTVREVRLRFQAPNQTDVQVAPNCRCAAIGTFCWHSAGKLCVYMRMLCFS